MEKNDQLNTTWRKVASTIYKKPVASKIFGGADLDVTELEAFVAKKRKEGIKITPTQFFVMALSQLLKSEVPEFNVYIRRGRIIARKSVDANVSVLMPGNQMGSVIVRNSDKKTLKKIETFMSKEIAKSRKGIERETLQNKNFISKLPWPFRSWFFSVYKVLVINGGLSIPFLKLSPNSFGSFILSNIGSVGLDYGFPALLPSSNVSFVFVMGGIQKKPVVMNDQVVIRRVMSGTIVFDHRVVDASHGAHLLRYLKQALKNPEEYVNSIETQMGTNQFD